MAQNIIRHVDADSPLSRRVRPGEALLSVNGKLVFRCFANDHFDPACVNPYVPISASFPYNMPRAVQEKIHAEIQRLLTLLHMGSTTYNFDMRIDADGNVYLMEVAPRNGGNYIPDVIRCATGVNLVELLTMPRAMLSGTHQGKR